MLPAASSKKNNSSVKLALQNVTVLAQKYLPPNTSPNQVEAVSKLITYYNHYFSVGMKFSERPSQELFNHLANTQRDLENFIKQLKLGDYNVSDLIRQALKIFFLALHIAEYAGQLSEYDNLIVRMLVLGEHRKLCLKDGNAPTKNTLAELLRQAVIDDDIDRVNRLLKRPILQIDEPDPYTGYTALHHAANSRKINYMKIVMALLKANANPTLLTHESPNGQQRPYTAFALLWKDVTSYSKQFVAMRRLLADYYIKSIVPSHIDVTEEPCSFPAVSPAGNLMFFSTKAEGIAYSDRKRELLDLEDPSNPVAEALTIEILDHAPRLKELYLHWDLQQYFPRSKPIRIISLGHESPVEFVPLMEYFDFYLFPALEITFIYYFESAGSEDNKNQDEIFTNILSLFNKFTNFLFIKAATNEVKSLIGRQIMPNSFDMVVLPNVRVKEKPEFANSLLLEIMPSLVKESAMVYASFYTEQDLGKVRPYFKVFEGEFGQKKDLGHTTFHCTKRNPITDTDENGNRSSNLLMRFNEAHFQELSNVHWQLHYHDEFVRAALPTEEAAAIKDYAALVKYYYLLYLNTCRQQQTPIKEERAFSDLTLQLLSDFPIPENIDIALALKIILSMTHCNKMGEPLNSTERSFMRLKIFQELGKQDNLKKQDNPSIKNEGIPTSRYTKRDLFVAAERGDATSLGACINAGIPVNDTANNSTQVTALHVATGGTSKEHLQCINLLLQANANPCLLADVGDLSEIPYLTALNRYVRNQTEIIKNCGRQEYTDVLCFLIEAYVANALTNPIQRLVGSKLFIAVSPYGELRLFEDLAGAHEFESAEMEKAGIDADRIRPPLRRGGFHA